MFAEYFNVSGELLHEQFVYGTYLDEVWVRQRMIPNGSGGYNPQYLFFHHDPLFSICGVTDTAGNLLEAYEYDPYGKRIVITDGPDPDALVNFTSDDLRGATSPLFIKPSFTGQRFDLETGLYYYKERYYHPGWGRFIKRDPIKCGGCINFYQYCKGNPIIFIDKLGLKEYTAVWEPFEILSLFPPRDVIKAFRELREEAKNQEYHLHGFWNDNNFVYNHGDGYMDEHSDG
jgi:RHS repeat-associated protein